MGMVADYGDEHIRTLDWKEHIRRRPGMYIGKLGDGTSADDGIYILIKEVLDNSVDEYMMGFGKSIDITIADDKTVTVRDYGRGVPLGKLVDVASKMNTGAKYDSKAFKKSVGLNGVGIKAVNALSDAFLIRSVRDGEARSVRFEKGNEIADVSESGVGEKNGTMVSFHADESVFGSYDFHMEYVESMVRNYTYLNAGLTIRVNGQAFVSKNGLLDLLQENLGVVSGAVTPLALMNDKEHKTLLVVDKDILRDEMVCCHPLTSDATVAMHRYDLIKFVRACGNEIKFLDIGDGEHTEE